MTDKEVSVIGVQRSADLNEILFLESLKYEDLSSLKLVLSGLVEKHQLQLTSPLAIKPESIRFKLLDALPVPKMN